MKPVFIIAIIKMISLKRKQIIFAVAIISALLMSGCARDTNSEADIDSIITTPGGSSNLPESVYISEIIEFPTLPCGKENIDNVLLANGKVYFTAWGDADEDAKFITHSLYSMDVNGSNLLQLPNYIPALFSPDMANGFVIVTALHADSEGFLWVAEMRGSEDTGSSNGSLEHFLRKLDDTGAEISIFNISGHAERKDFFYVNTLNVDYAGNIYIASGTDIYILDNRGVFIFGFDNPDWAANLIRLSDGIVAFISQQEGNVFLKKIDIERKTWGEIIRLPSNIPRAQSVFSGTADYLYLYNDKSHLNGILTESNESIRVLSWVDSTLSSEDIDSFMFMPDGSIAVIKQQIQNDGTPAKPELILLTVSSVEPSDKIQLTFATFNFDSSRRYAVEQFNENSSTHRINVTDYSQFNTGYDQSLGELKLTTEIITGNPPDILDVGLMRIHDFISHGLLIDMYPLLDADPELGRDNILKSVLTSTEINGFLYRIVPSFFIGTIYGSSSVLGNYPGWNIDEFISVLESNPQADLPLGPQNSRFDFFNLAVGNNLDMYVDRISGTAFFDNEDFIKLLEIANTFPMESDDTGTEMEYNLIAQGRQIMYMWYFWDLFDYLGARDMFGDDLVFKGFPTMHRDGSVIMPLGSISITAGCTEPDAAWEFVRIFLIEEYQRDFVSHGLPVNRIVFDERLEAMKEPFQGTIVGPAGIIENTVLLQEEIDRIKSMVDNIARINSEDQSLWRIVREGAYDFFNGRNTAEDTVRIIQSRVMIYLSEQAR